MTAERTLHNFLVGWRTTNKKKMFKHCSKTWKAMHKAEEFEGIDLISFRILEEKIGKRIADYVVLLKKKDKEYTVKCRLVKELAPYTSSDRGVWGVYPASFRYDKKDLSIFINNVSIDSEIKKEEKL